MAYPFGSRFLYHDRRQVEGDPVSRDKGGARHLPGGSLARCGCRWDAATEELNTKDSCTIHGHTRTDRGLCPQCSDRRWLPAGVGWSGWYLRSRCPSCNPLAEVETSDALVKRLAPCRSTWKWVVKLHRKRRIGDW